MILDSDHNYLYLADCLPKKYPSFYSELQNALDEAEIAFDFLPNCKDVWVKDFMPIQITDNLYCGFEYNPDYLLEKKWHATITDTNPISNQLGLAVLNNNLIMDGGNVIKFENSILCCDKLLIELERTFEKRNYFVEGAFNAVAAMFLVQKVNIIPTPLNDYMGHADGIVRYIDEETVLINNYAEDPKLEPDYYERKLKIALHNLGLKYKTIPYNPYGNIRYDDATGFYINFLQVGNTIFFPQFNLPEDKEALETIRSIYPDCSVYPIICTEIAKGGGVLNCVGWGVKRSN